MITASKLTSTMYMFNGKILGTTTDDITTLTEQVKNDINTNISDILFLNLDLDLEPVEDSRTLSQCYIGNVQMLINFKTKVRVDDMIWLIKSYLNHLLIPIQ